jgi:hypothetical protein
VVIEGGLVGSNNQGVRGSRGASSLNLGFFPRERAVVVHIQKKQDLDTNKSLTNGD